MEFEPLPVRTVRGSVAGLPDSIIAGSVLDDGLHVIIKLDAQDTYWIQPLGEHVAGAVERNARRTLITRTEKHLRRTAFVGPLDIITGPTWPP